MSHLKITHLCEWSWIVLECLEIQSKAEPPEFTIEKGAHLENTCQDSKPLLIHCTPGLCCPFFWAERTPGVCWARGRRGKLLWDHGPPRRLPLRAAQRRGPEYRRRGWKSPPRVLPSIGMLFGIWGRVCFYEENTENNMKKIWYLWDDCRTYVGACARGFESFGVRNHFVKFSFRPERHSVTLTMEKWYYVWKYKEMHLFMRSSMLLAMWYLFSRGRPLSLSAFTCPPLCVCASFRDLTLTSYSYICVRLSPYWFLKWQLLLRFYGREGLE